MSKLVRDLIPKIIEDNGETPILDYVDGNEMKKALLEKLLEETQEVIASKDKAQTTEELADLLEVIEAIINEFDIDVEELFDTKQKKLDERGGFEQGIILKGTK